MAEREHLPHAVAAMLRLAGPQPTNVAVQHPGTEEATVTIAVRNCLMYLRTQGAANGIDQIWRRAALEARHLPVRVRTVESPRTPSDAAEPSVVVHTKGRPPGFVRLQREPGTTNYLHVQVGGLTFYFHDQRAFESVAGAFFRAAQLGAQHLPEIDQRQTSIDRNRAARLAGHAATGAREHLEQIARHPVRVAAAMFTPLASGAQFGDHRPVREDRPDQQGPPASRPGRTGLQSGEQHRPGGPTR